MVLEAARSVLIVVDIQERLVPAMHGLEPVLRNAALLMQAAARLDVPVVVTEQYPRGLGRTVEPVAALAPPGAVIEKVEFSAAHNDSFNRRLDELGRPEVVVCGIEAHVCVYQTALHLRDLGYGVELVGDCVTSRAAANRELAVSRLAARGVGITGLEMCLYELAVDCRAACFRPILELIR